MELSPQEPFDIESLDAVRLDLTLDLPSIPVEDVSIAIRGLNGLLDEFSGTTAVLSPKLFTEVLCRAMLAVSREILEEPEAVFRVLRVTKYRPWKRRRVSLLAPSARQSPRNHAALLEQLRELGADDEAIDRLFLMATIRIRRQAMETLANAKATMVLSRATHTHMMALGMSEPLRFSMCRPMP